MAVKTVDKGRVTLEGKVRWKYQKDAAYRTVAHLTGVRGVTSLITLKPTMRARMTSTGTDPVRITPRGQPQRAGGARGDYLGGCPALHCTS
jgi:osmotically-inducible protein OsmY